MFVLETDLFGFEPYYVCSHEVISNTLRHEAKLKNIWSHLENSSIFDRWHIITKMCRHLTFLITILKQYLYHKDPCHLKSGDVTGSLPVTLD